MGYCAHRLLLLSCSWGYFFWPVKAIPSPITPELYGIPVGEKVEGMMTLTGQKK
jgi:hypothetical protein